MVGKNSLYNPVMSKLKENRTISVLGKEETFKLQDPVCSSETHCDWYLTGVSASLGIVAIVLWIWHAFQARPAVVRPSNPSTNAPTIPPPTPPHNAPTNPFVFVPFPPSSTPPILGREEEYRLHEQLRVAVNTACLSYQDLVTNAARGQPGVAVVEHNTAQDEIVASNAERAQPGVSIDEHNTAQDEAEFDGDLCEQFVLMDSKKQSDVAVELGKTQSEITKELEDIRTTFTF